MTSFPFSFGFGFGVVVSIEIMAWFDFEWAMSLMIDSSWFASANN